MNNLKTSSKQQPQEISQNQENSRKFEEDSQKVLQLDTNGDDVVKLQLPGSNGVFCFSPRNSPRIDQTGVFY